MVQNAHKIIQKASSIQQAITGSHTISRPIGIGLIIVCERTSLTTQVKRTLNVTQFEFAVRQFSPWEYSTEVIPQPPRRPA